MPGWGDPFTSHPGSAAVRYSLAVQLSLTPHLEYNSNVRSPTEDRSMH